MAPKKDWKVVRELKSGRHIKACIVKDADANLKVLVTAGNAGSPDRLKRNAEMLLGLEHTSLTKIEEITVGEDGRPVIVTEYFRGEPISLALDAAGLPMVIAHFRQMLEGIAFIHDLGFLHLNLKPKCIFTDFYHGQTKIINWWHLHTSEDIAKRNIHFSPLYVAPEIVLGGRIDARADLFSVGAILYEIWTGQAPYAERDCSKSKLPAHIKEEKDKEIWLAYQKIGNNAADEPLRSLMENLLKKDPSQRPFRNARDVIDYIVKTWPDAARPAKELYGRTIMTTMRL